MILTSIDHLNLCGGWWGVELLFIDRKRMHQNNLCLHSLLLHILLALHMLLMLKNNKILRSEYMEWKIWKSALNDILLSSPRITSSAFTSLTLQAINTQNQAGVMVSRETNYSIRDQTSIPLKYPTLLLAVSSL